jgi:hypothetical protein
VGAISRPRNGAVGPVAAKALAPVDARRGRTRWPHYAHIPHRRFGGLGALRSGSLVVNAAVMVGFTLLHD